jgi:hypothetical protein
MIVIDPFRSCQLTVSALKSLFALTSPATMIEAWTKLSFKSSCFISFAMVPRAVGGILIWTYIYIFIYVWVRKAGWKLAEVEPPKLRIADKLLPDVAATWILYVHAYVVHAYLASQDSESNSFCFAKLGGGGM